MSKLRVFISYSSEDRQRANKICSYLEACGKSCWIAPRDIPVGAEYGEEIIKGIEGSDIVVLVFSAAANNSQHVLREIERAVNKKIPIISFMLEKCELSKSMEYFLCPNQWLDASSDMGAMLPALNNSISAAFSGDSESVAVFADNAADTEKMPDKKTLIIIGACVVGVIAVVVLLVLLLGNKDSDTPESESSTETSQTTITSETTALTTAYTEALTTAATSESEPLPELHAGEYIEFGSYFPVGYSRENNDGRIIWQILEVDADGQRLKLIAKDILDIKPFDCAESGKYGYDKNEAAHEFSQGVTYTDEQMMQFYGSSSWKHSDLRSWLNAIATVEYPGAIPTNRATNSGANAFGNQQGFLSSFSDEELALLCDNELENGVSDRVYLLSMDEVNAYSQSKWFILNPSVTKSAAASDSSNWYESFKSGSNDYLWATRTSEENSACNICTVMTKDAQERYDFYPAAISGFGIRPAITVSYDASKLTGIGNVGVPYQFKP